MSEKKVLIVVDMQHDFIDGALGTAEAREIVDRAAEYIRKKRGQGYTVIATLDTHGEDYMKTREGRMLPVPHCIRGTEGWRLHPAIASAVADGLLLEKPTFGSVKLPEIVAEGLAEGDGLTVELIGLCTDICVVSNAMLLKARFPEAEISVKADCCAGVTAVKHQAALETMASCQIHII